MPGSRRRWPCCSRPLWGESPTAFQIFKASGRAGCNCALKSSRPARRFVSTTNAIRQTCA
eukprot:9484242-Pyramimonas_sp.AAC.1